MQAEQDSPIRIARSPAELSAIFRFRYRVFTAQLGRSDLEGADHERGLLTDALDAVSTHFYAGPPGQPVAALTISPVDSAAMAPSLAAFFNVERLASAVSPGHMAFANWLLVDPAEAGSAMVTALIGAASEEALRNGVQLVLTFCRPGLVSFYERLGFEQYRHAAELSGFGLRCPLLLVLRDQERLRAIRSPLHRLLRRSGQAGDAGQLRLDLEPLIDLFQASQILVNDDLWINAPVSFVARVRPGLFAGLPEASIRQIMRLGSVITCAAGEIVTRGGETSDDMFLIAEGRFSARRGMAATARELGEGDLFGESEHLSGLPRSETVTCVSGGHIAAFKAASLFQWMRQNPEPGVTLAVNLARLIALRSAAESAQVRGA